MTSIVRASVRVEGVVQGVGFRPFVYSLATRLGLAGWVGNDVDGVFAEVEGSAAGVKEFLGLLEAQPPPLTEVLPRMDVPVLVGFAAAGPLHAPVPVEDPDHFAALFGADAPLAWDAERGAPAYAYLAPAVRAFFRNGGRRCWVVRVAGPARANAFPLPGLARLRKDGSLAPAFAATSRF